MKMERRVAVVVVNYNTKRLLERCLLSVQQVVCDGIAEVIVVDNGSSDGSAELVRGRYPEVTILQNDRNRGFAAACNQGICASGAELILLLNSDAYLHAGSLESMVRCFDRDSEVKAAGPRLLNDDGSVQRSWYRFPSSAKVFAGLIRVSEVAYRLARIGGVRWLIEGAVGTVVPESGRLPGEKDFDYLTFACFMIRRPVLERLGGLDEGLGFYHEDCDIGFKLRRGGYRVAYMGEAVVTHSGGMSSGLVPKWAFVQYYRSLLIVVRRHLGRWVEVKMRVAVGFGVLIRAAIERMRGRESVVLGGVYKRSQRRGDRTDETGSWVTYREVLRLAARGVSE